MKIEMKKIFCAAMVSAAISVSAATQSAPLSTNAPAVSSTTNTSTDASIAALFGDPVIVKGKGFDIKRSELDWVLTGAKASAAAAGQNLPPDFEITILNQLITIQVLLQTATDADRAAGRQEASMQL